MDGKKETDMRSLLAITIVTLAALLTACATTNAERSCGSTGPPPPTQELGLVTGNPHMRRSLTIDMIQVHEHLDGTWGMNGRLVPSATIDNGPENKPAK